MLALTVLFRKPSVRRGFGRLAAWTDFDRIMISFPCTLKSLLQTACHGTTLTKLLVVLEANGISLEYLPELGQHFLATRIDFENF
jgi:hypothetical protein